MEVTSQTYTPNKKASFQAAPIELKIFFLFSVLVSLIDIYLSFIGPRELKESLLPFTGWQISGGYFLCAIFGFILILGYSTKPSFTRNIILFLLCNSIFWGTISFITSIGADSFNNPYLTVSAWRPIWTIAIPAIWIAILLNPRINRYCHDLLDLNYR